METLELARVVFTYPAIDNHAHPLLKAQNRNVFPLEGIFSEAEGSSLTQDAIHTLACFRATAQLSKLYNEDGEPNWEALKLARQSAGYEELCRLCFGPTGIQCILIDDGLGTPELAENYKWHDQFTKSPTKRIVRVEVLAESILRKIFDSQIQLNLVTPLDTVKIFPDSLFAALRECAQDSEVVGFKSIVCYRTGLDISPQFTVTESWGQPLTALMLRYEATRELRLADKVINDFVVHATLQVAAECDKPVQFHTGLGDHDIALALSDPALMQPIIKAYPSTKIVLLHSGYPYTRQAGYLTAVYPNVFLDFGEIFPVLSADGQKQVVKQVLELCPTNKIMWSTDGHWWPETYYLGALQARETLFQVLSKSVRKQQMTEKQAISLVIRALFENANTLYGLNLQPHGLVPVQD